MVRRLVVIKRSLRHFRVPAVTPDTIGALETIARVAFSLHEYSLSPKTLLVDRSLATDALSIREASFAHYTPPIQSFLRQMALSDPR